MAEEKITGKTSSGFEYSIDKRVLTDMEVVDDIYEIFHDNQESMLSPLLTKILGKDQKKALYDHVRDADGFVSTQLVCTELGEILNGAGKQDSDVKNS